MKVIINPLRNPKAVVGEQDGVFLKRGGHVLYVSGKSTAFNSKAVHPGFFPPFLWGARAIQRSAHW